MQERRNSVRRSRNLAAVHMIHDVSAASGETGKGLEAIGNKSSKILILLVSFRGSLARFLCQFARALRD